VAACFFPSAVRPVASIFSGLTERPPLGVHGLGHPVHALALVRRAETTRRGTYRPDGVRDAFQVIAHIVEPSVSVTVCNLLAKDNDRARLADEPEERRP
jgi:hypothetical protein